MTCVSEIKKKVLIRCGPYMEIKDNLRCKEAVVGDGERRKRCILCHNPKEEKRTRKHRGWAPTVENVFMRAEVMLMFRA